MGKTVRESSNRILFVWIIVIVAMSAGIGAPARAESPVQYGWQEVGRCRAFDCFTTGPAYWVSFIIYNGIPFLAYADGYFGSPKVIIPGGGPGGGPWPLGGPYGFSQRPTRFESLGAYNNTLYLAYQDMANGGKATVMEDTGNSWPIRNFNGWHPVGNPVVSSGQAPYESLAVYEGIPYVAYQDGANGGKATVMEYTGNSWHPLGMPGFSEGPTQYESLAVYEGTPYIAYQDGVNGDKATVMECSGNSWLPVGSPGFSKGPASYESLVVSDGTPFVAYQDGAQGNKPAVMAYTGIIAPEFFSPGIPAIMILGVLGIVVFIRKTGEK